VVYFAPRDGDFRSLIAADVTCVELARRLPDVLIDVREPRESLPDGGFDCVVVDGGSLGIWQPSDFKFLMGLEQISPAIRPTVWQSVKLPADKDVRGASGWDTLLARARLVSVTDVPSRERLEAACGDLRVDLHPALSLLAPQVIPPPVAERELKRAREAGFFPSQGSPVVMQLGPESIQSIETILRSQVDLNLVILPETGSALAPWEQLQTAFEGRLWVFDAGMTVEYATAAIVSASLVIATSEAMCVAAFAYGRPWLPLGLPSDDSLAALPTSMGSQYRGPLLPESLPSKLGQLAPTKPNRGLLSGLQAELDRHFDRVAEVVYRAAWARRRAPEELGGDGDVIDMPQYQLELQATQMGERRLHDELRIMAALDQENAVLKQRLTTVQDQLDALRATRTFRYSRWPRSAWARLLRSTRRR
jgi:hypothetical protein